MPLILGILFMIIPGIVVLVVFRKKKRNNMKKQTAEGEKIEESTQKRNRPSEPELLRQYYELYQSGAISQEDYEEIKNRTLNR